jgi:hypothetical protein
MCAFLWMSTDVIQGGKCIITWAKVQRPLDMVGLGVLDLKVFGRALRLCLLWLNRADRNRIWVFLPSAEDPALTTFFWASTFHEVGNGVDIRFWKDSWVDGCRIAQLAQELVTVVSAHKQRQRSLASALEGDSWIGDITGALTMPVFAQYLQIRGRIQGT